MITNVVIFQQLTNFFLRNSFNLWRPLLKIALYHQTKTPVSFCCRRGLNRRSLIQPSETLPVELVGTTKFDKTLSQYLNFRNK